MRPGLRPGSRRAMVHFGPLISETRATMAIKFIERNAHVCFEVITRTTTHWWKVRKRKQEVIRQSTFSFPSSYSTAVNHIQFPSSLDQAELWFESCVLQNAQCPFFHLLGLCSGFVQARLKIRPAMFPSHLDGGFHIFCQDDKLRRSAVVMGAKAYDVDLSHSGPQNSGKSREEQEV
jgi:hypothetical protein